LHCTKCGAPNSPGAQFCSNCGNTLTQQPATTAPVPGSGTIPPPYAGTPQTSGKAVGSLICGIINIFPLFIVLALAVRNRPALQTVLTIGFTIFLMTFALLFVMNFPVY